MIQRDFNRKTKIWDVQRRQLAVLACVMFIDEEKGGNENMAEIRINAAEMLIVKVCSIRLMTLPIGGSPT